jgi:hypothetical protein
MAALGVAAFMPGKQASTQTYEPGVKPIVTISIFILFIVFCFILGRGIA